MSKIHKNCKLIILDLDNTLVSNNDFIYTETNFTCKNYPKLRNHIFDILNYFKEEDKIIVLASLNSYADDILKTYNITYLFDKVYYKNWRIYGDHKSDFFINIRSHFNIPYENMLYFDDITGHCREARDFGIKYVKVDPNALLQWKDVYDGLALFD